MEASTQPFSDPDDSLISIFRVFLPPTALPHLKTLHSESLVLACTLVPRRQITHLWVPGATFAVLVTSDIGPVLSLRIALDLPPHALTDVLLSISQNLLGLRVLGFLPASILDPMNDDKVSSLSAKTGPASPLPCFRHLHTICLWSTPSRRAVISLENSTNLPALCTLACLHFSPAFEWLCLPLNETDGGTSGGYHGGIQWKHETGVEGKISARRRLTAVHDPENQLWHDV
ncbi:uncharacterized protein FOMMEDRAFT_155820 [Fomitiporia mediterranea MF3/22]|uniref:uncharacterized protein n=1 Tax=Fomitiporia mediterranea (strain MF3/22) TaxID=694068 RepID=UPI00044072E8|nr:uncharacterized protein FOMMEDRAFT_155820 [Fomitiporia mediterranea MF3/22]EJD04653.1 hypothetical protein FOMMEDRAFT_155820 [Fomitiporia mediterranea MF3/22]